jgi:microcin C transport system substrate-binding protein
MLAGKSREHRSGICFASNNGMMMIRTTSGLKAIAATALLVLACASASADEKRHATSLIGTPKHGPDFKHFDYVNPNAPKGGSVRLWAMGTFDSFNIIPYKGNKAAAIGLIYDTLMASSMDESSAEYSQIAEWVSYPADFSSVTYKIRDAARWHDGKPMTPEDVIFSLDVLKKNNPQYAFYYKNVTGAEKTGEREVTFRFDEKNNRELPQIVGQLLVLPKHFYEDKKLDPAGTWLEPPLGSGAYKVKAFEAGRFVVLERVKDYWAADLPVNVGQNNIDEIRYDYYRDQDVAFEAFKAGQIDYFSENSAKSWATRYDFPALRAGKVIKRGDIILQNPQAMQAIVFNTRRGKFADARVRQAFGLVYNFEWLNQNIFYGQYKRTSSYFENTEMAAKGLPQGKELAILEEVRSQVPPEVFTTEYKNAVNATPTDERNNVRAALKLLQEAGWEVKNGALTNSKTGEMMTIEFLTPQESALRYISPYMQTLEKLGVKSTARVIDTPQYQQRTDNFDFDAVIDVFAQSESPGNEQRDTWGSAAADRAGSRNSIGIKNPAVDKLIDKIIFAKDREELVAACKALDRVLLWNHYVVPQFHTPYSRFAYWNRYSHPQTLPARAIGFPTIWWYDQEKAAKLSATQ